MSHKAAIIGAGAAGVVSAKILLQGGWKPDVFEQYDVTGGTWNYDDKGAYKHSAMYKNLRTNLPKELMLLEGLDYNVGDCSFISHEQVLEYLNQYVEKFSLNRVIKFNTKVTKVKWSSTCKWIVTSNATSEGKPVVNEEEYDAVFICNGHYFEPQVPEFDGSSIFEGRTLHSHSYRVPDQFAGQTVLIIGSGPSGVDIAVDLSSHAKTVYLSHHQADLELCSFPDIVILKPDVQNFNENSVTFKDGTTKNIDAIIYCTGYKFSFPFMDENCGIRVDDNYVNPLYGQLINVHHPTMFFIGLPFRTFIFQMLEMQAKCCIRILNREVELPSSSDMERARLDEVEALKKKGYPKRKYHLIGGRVEEYLATVARIGNLPTLDNVFFKIYEYCGRLRKNNFLSYRETIFKIIDENNYEVYRSS